MRKSRRALAVASAFPLVIGGAVSAFARSTDSTNAPVKALGVVTITGGQPPRRPRTHPPPVPATLVHGRSEGEFVMCASKPINTAPSVLRHLRCANF